MSYWFTFAFAVWLMLLARPLVSSVAYSCYCKMNQGRTWAKDLIWWLRVEWFAPQTKHTHTATPFFASRYREIGKNRVQIKHSHMIRSNIQNRYGIQHKTCSWISHRVFHFPIAYGKESEATPKLRKHKSARMEQKTKSHDSWWPGSALS